MVRLELQTDRLMIDGVYDTTDAALAACVDDRTAACRIEVNKDYRYILDFEIIHPKLLTSEPDAMPKLRGELAGNRKP